MVQDQAPRSKQGHDQTIVAQIQSSKYTYAQSHKGKKHPHHIRKAQITNEAARSGNSLDSLKADWLDPGLADLNSAEEIRSWWFQLVQAMGIDEYMFQRMLGSLIDPELHTELAEKIVLVRDEVHERLVEAGLDDAVYRFDPDKFNPAVPLGGNLMFAAPKVEISQDALVRERGFLALISEQGMAEQAIAISQTVIETLHQTFGICLLYTSPSPRDRG